MRCGGRCWPTPPRSCSPCSWLEETGPGAVLFEIFGAVVLALAIWSVRASPGPTWIAVTLAVVASGLSILDAINPNPALDVASAVCHALFYFWAAGSLMVYMLSDRTVTTDELFAVGATFTLVAWGFAYVFEIVQTVQPGCFIAAVSPEGQRTWMELLFLSFTNPTCPAPACPMSFRSPDKHARW